MMISALARGYQVLGDERYLAAAERAADFILGEMVRDGDAIARLSKRRRRPPRRQSARLSSTITPK